MTKSLKIPNLRLWHELTLELNAALLNPDFVSIITKVYSNFVIDFQQKMNKISLIRFVSLCAQQKKPQEALKFLDGFRTELENEDEAQVLLETEYCNYLLTTNQFDECLKKLRECELLMDKFQYSETVVNASFYRVSAAYYKVFFKFR